MVSQLERRICDTLRECATSFRGKTDEALREHIARALSVPVVYARVRLGHARVDLLVDGIAIACRLRGPTTPLVDDLRRVAKHARVHALILATASRVMSDAMPMVVGGKSIWVVMFPRAA